MQETLPQARPLSEFRNDFPVLEREFGGRRLIFLDSAASSQKPRAVVDAMTDYYYRSHANVHRGAYGLSREATGLYEAARQSLADFLGAGSEKEIVFTRNTTEAINLVAHGWGRRHVRQGDEIIVSHAEHHANLVPWHMLAAATGAVVRAIPLDADLRLDLEAYAGLLGPRTRLVSVAHMGNVTGVTNPITQMAAMAHAAGALFLADGAQGAPHMPVDVRELGADFYTVSGHKMCGPTGAGALWGRPEVLESMDPFLGGGEMIREVYVDRSSFAGLPSRLEAGTPAIAEVIGLGVAARYLSEIGMQRIHDYDTQLTLQALAGLKDVPGVTLYGPEGEDRGGIVSFNLDGVHAHDVAAALDRRGIAVRSGKHCAQPLMRWIGIDACVRASFYFYNTPEEIDRFVEAVGEVRGELEPSADTGSRDCSPLRPH